MKHTFVNNGDGWWLRLWDDECLADYLDKIWTQRKSIAEKNFALMTNKNYCLKNLITHCSNSLVYLYGNSEGDQKEFSKKLELVGLQYALTLKMFMKEHGVVYINSVGGCTPCLPKRPGDNKPNEVIVKEGPDFPVFTTQDLIIKQWQDGEHFYLYAGNFPIYIDGKNKWNTKEEAILAGETYVKELTSYRNKVDKINEI